jgi:hypothetical protein
MKNVFPVHTPSIHPSIHHGVLVGDIRSLWSLAHVLHLLINANQCINSIPGWRSQKPGIVLNLINAANIGCAIVVFVNGL